jgi:hypothetical protein
VQPLEIALGRQDGERPDDDDREDRDLGSMLDRRCASVDERSRGTSG